MEYGTSLFSSSDGHCIFFFEGTHQLLGKYTNFPLSSSSSHSFSLTLSLAYSRSLNLLRALASHPVASNSKVTKKYIIFPFFSFSLDSSVVTKSIRQVENEMCRFQYNISMRPAMLTVAVMYGQFYCVSSVFRQ